MKDWKLYVCAEDTWRNLQRKKLTMSQTYWVAGYQPLLVTGRKYGSSFHLVLDMLLVTGSQREK